MDPKDLTQDSDPKDSWPGEKSSFHSFDQYSFQIEGVNGLVVVPDEIAPRRPWVWRARFFGVEPQTDVALLKRGFHVVYCNVCDLYGAPAAVERWNTFYRYLTETHDLDRKVSLEGLSRGGLIVYNWAVQNPDKVHCIYADNPVCDFKSWPGGKLDGPGDAASWQNCLAAYEMTEEEALAYTGNPVDNLAPLAAAGIPLLHVVGDCDEVVPVAENSTVIEDRYTALGGHIEVIHKPTCGHHPHSLPDPEPIVNFILKHSGQ